MINSNEVIKKAGIIPKLQLAVGTPPVSTGPHTVKLISDKLTRRRDFKSGEEKLAMKYIVEEDGQTKSYTTDLKDGNGDPTYLIQRLAAFAEGTEVIMEYVRKGAKGYISVIPVNPADEPSDGEDDGIDISDENESGDPSEGEDGSDIPF